MASWPAGASVRFDADAIVHRVPETLLSAAIPLSRLDAHVAEQKLKLFQFTAGIFCRARLCTVSKPEARLARVIGVFKRSASRIHMP
jgi:hypothetical protein